MELASELGVLLFVPTDWGLVVVFMLSCSTPTQARICSFKYTSSANKRGRIEGMARSMPVILAGTSLHPARRRLAVLMTGFPLHTRTTLAYSCCAVSFFCAVSFCCAGGRGCGCVVGLTGDWCATGLRALTRLRIRGRLFVFLEVGTVADAELTVVDGRGQLVGGSFAGLSSIRKAAAWAASCSTALPGLSMAGVTFMERFFFARRARFKRFAASVARVRTRTL